MFINKSRRWHYCSSLDVAFKTAKPPSNPEKAAFAAGVAAEPRRVVKHLTQVPKQVLITMKVTDSVSLRLCSHVQAHAIL